MEDNIRQVLRLRLPPQRKLAIIRRLLSAFPLKQNNKQTSPVFMRQVPQPQQRAPQLPNQVRSFGFMVQRPLRQPPASTQNKRKDENLISKKALLVGSNYPGTQYPLQGCLNDVNFMRDKLNSLTYSQITLLTDGAQAKPTKGNVINSFINLLVTSQPGDTLFFGYSGHGSYVRDRNGDERDKRDEVVVCSDMNYITDDEFKQILNQSMKPKTRLFCVMDACHSGSLLDLKYQWLDSSNMDQLTINKKQPETPGQVILISGCMDSQTSSDAYINKTFRGAMLWSFLQVINANPKISFKDLITNMRNVLKANKFSQVPQLSSGQNLDINSKLFL
jgi:hypothetical protein